MRTWPNVDVTLHDPTLFNITDVNKGELFCTVQIQWHDPFMTGGASVL